MFQGDYKTIYRGHKTKEKQSKTKMLNSKVHSKRRSKKNDKFSLSINETGE